MPQHLIASDRTIRAVRLGDSRKRLKDGDGLYLLLFLKGGAHCWRFDYSFAGKRKTLSLGTFPDTGLALARTKASEMRCLIAGGTDPGVARRELKVAVEQRLQHERLIATGGPLPDSFEYVAREWWTVKHLAQVSAGHAATTLKRLERDIFPWIGSMQLGEVRPVDLLSCLRRVEDRGTIETAHRIKYSCNQIFRFAKAAGICHHNPASDLDDALRVARTRHRAAIIEPEQAGALLRAIHDYRGTLAVRTAFKLAPLVFQRPGELRAMRWSEVNLEEAMWTIPAKRMKRTQEEKDNGDDHLVPLAPQAVQLLREIWPFTGRGVYVFPSPRSKDRPLSSNAILSALRRMGYEKSEMSGHGFRAMARTMLAERLGVEEKVIEVQLGHTVHGPLGKAYDRAKFLEQRRVMMVRWADYLDQLRQSA